MIEGVVKSDEARISIMVVGLEGRQREIDAVIDTGYTASLTLPPALIAELGLRWQSLDRGTLADGSECVFDVFEAEVEWDGATRRILVDEAGTDPLIGMGLLWGYELKIEVCAGGKVTLTRLSSGGD